jgi:autophagy-related protein 17
VLKSETVHQTRSDFLQHITEALDKASANLNSTLNSLRQISVEPAFRPVDEEPKNLFDFVDEIGVNDLYDSVRQCIDRCDDARHTLIETYTSFDNDLRTIGQALQPDEEDQQQPYSHDEDVSPIPSLFYSLEHNATACAEHLQGLVKHYDACVSALKHTEGGGEMVSKFSHENQEETHLEGLGIEIPSPEEETLKSYTTEEHVNRMKILVRDAAEVEDVVGELNDRIAEMEEHLSQIQSYVYMLRSTSKRQARASSLVKHVARNVPSYINACADFQAHWEEEQESLISKVEEIGELQEFYLGFASGYDNLILEVQRRRHTMRDMEKIAKQAMSQIEKLHKSTNIHIPNSLSQATD